MMAKSIKQQLAFTDKIDNNTAAALSDKIKKKRVFLACVLVKHKIKVEFKAFFSRSSYAEHASKR